jgi:hypothetical protein
MLVPLRSGDDDHRVAGVWPRCAKIDGTDRSCDAVDDHGPDISSVLSLAKYERGGEVDYRNRMIMNALALVANAALIAAGVWLAVNIHD